MVFVHENFVTPLLVASVVNACTVTAQEGSFVNLTTANLIADQAQITALTGVQSINGNSFFDGIPGATGITESRVTQAQRVREQQAHKELKVLRVFLCKTRYFK